MHTHTHTYDAEMRWNGDGSAHTIENVFFYVAEEIDLMCKYNVEGWRQQAHMTEKKTQHIIVLKKVKALWHNTWYWIKLKLQRFILIFKRREKSKRIPIKFFEKKNGKNIKPTDILRRNSFTLNGKKNEPPETDQAWMHFGFFFFFFYLLVCKMN